MKGGAIVNRITLQELVKGCYGRKVAYTKYEEVNEKNVINIVGDCIKTFFTNRRVCQYLWDYYKGDQPIRYRVKTIRDDVCNNVVENRAFEIVRFKNAQTFGEPIQLVSRKDDDKLNKQIDIICDMMKDADKHVKDVTCGEWISATGIGFKAIQRKQDDIPFRIVVPTPLNTFIIYQQNTQEPLLAVQQLKDTDGLFYYHCYSEKFEYVIKNSTLVPLTDGQNNLGVYSRLHVYDGIPIVEYRNNSEGLSDIELVIDLLDAINNYQSNRVDAVQQFVQSFIKFVNCEIDRETFQKMKMDGVLAVKSNNSQNKADVEIMTQELNQEQTQIAKDDLWNSALSILAIPNKQGNTGGDSQGAVELRNGWDFAKSAARLKDAFIVSSERRFIKLILEEVKRKMQINKQEFALSYRDFDIVISHSPQDNMIIKAQCLEYLLRNGIHPLIAIKTCGLWHDAEKTFLLSKPYLDNIYKSIDMVEEQEQKAVDLKKKFDSKLQQNTNNEGVSE